MQMVGGLNKMSKRSRLMKPASVAMAAVLATGCAADGSMDPNFAKALGAAGGAVLGFVACKGLAGGTDTECALVALAGGVAGYVITEKVMEADKAKRQANLAAVLETNQPVGYTSRYQVAETGSSGSVQLLDITTDASGRQCKQLRETYDTAADAAVSEDYKMCKQGDQWVNA
jgi:hypothetical protein